MRAMNILSIDLEDYFMVTALEGAVRREDWHRYESRIERSTYRLLEILDCGFSTAELSNGGCSGIDGDSGRTGAIHATFFCLGWVGERYPHLIKEIQSRGHEIASHGYDHRLVSTMSRTEFREDIRRSKGVLEDLAGRGVMGYRAPSYSVTRETLWALDVLAREGFVYDSSIFPIHHDRYGLPGAPRTPFMVSGNGDGGWNPLPLGRRAGTGSRPSFDALEPLPDFLMEFPVSTLRIFGQNIPVAGGGYFRLFPICVTEFAMGRIKRESEAPFVFYMHPWEIDPGQPRIRGISLKSRFRHYVNLGRTEARLKRLLGAVPFSSFRDYISTHLSDDDSC